MVDAHIWTISALWTSLLIANEHGNSKGDDLKTSSKELGCFRCIVEVITD